MPRMMQIGAEEIHIPLFDEIFGERPDFPSVMAGEREQIELKETAAFAELVVPALIARKIEIPLRMGQHGLITLELQIEKDLLQIDGRDDKGKLYKDEIVLQRKESRGPTRARRKSRRAGQLVSEPIIHEIFRSGAEFHRDTLAPKLCNHAVATAKDDLWCILEVIAVDMRRRDELPIAQVDEPTDQLHRRLEIGRAIVDAGDEMGVDVTANAFEAIGGPGLLFK